jgi:hypothetical protein
MGILLGCAPAPDPCAVGAAMDRVDEAMDTLAALPAPVTLECFLASLERPLGVVFTSDVFNTQPAQGFRSPRILIRTPSLTLTAVPVGEARRLLELGEAHPTGLTVKAELEFPVDGPVDPYERTLAWPGAPQSGCQVCHFEEIEVEPGRFANTPLRPPDGMVVPVELLREEHARCDWGADPDRCAMFAAIFDHGEVFEDPFPAEMATQFGPQP